MSSTAEAFMDPESPRREALEASLAFFLYCFLRSTSGCDPTFRCLYREYFLGDGYSLSSAKYGSSSSNSMSLDTGLGLDVVASASFELESVSSESSDPASQ